MPQFRLVGWALTCAGVGCALMSLVASTPQAGRADILVLSTRADLVTGGDALVEVRLPPGASHTATRVAVDGRDVTASFDVRSDGRYLGLVTELRNGRSTLTVTVSGRERGRLAVTNHPPRV